MRSVNWVQGCHDSLEVVLYVLLTTSKKPKRPDALDRRISSLSKHAVVLVRLFNKWTFIHFHPPITFKAAPFFASPLNISGMFGIGNGYRLRHLFRP
jgi:hypothetical protein